MRKLRLRLAVTCIVIGMAIKLKDREKSQRIKARDG